MKFHQCVFGNSLLPSNSLVGQLGRDLLTNVVRVSDSASSFNDVNKFATEVKYQIGTHFAVSTVAIPRQSGNAVCPSNHIEVPHVSKNRKGLFNGIFRAIS